MTSPVANGHPSPPVPADAAPTPARPDPDVPQTSLEDDGLSRRPRDARLIHLVLSSLGIHSYQDRVPLQLLDFAYRYTSSVLSDSLRLSAEGYAGQNDRGGRGRGGGGGEESITVTALRQAIASRQGYTFQGALPKEFMMERAQEHNRTHLPKVERGYGVQLPPEKYCLTGVGWNIRDEWDSDEEVVQENGDTAGGKTGEDDERMGGMDGGDDEDDEGAGRMEDVFGEGGGDVSMNQD